MNPDFYLAQWALGWTDLQAGKPSEAIPELDKAGAIDAPPFVVGYLGYVYAAAGQQRSKAETILADLNRMSSRRFVSPYCTALVHLGLGDKPGALDELEEAYAVHSQMLLLIKMDKVFDPLRSEPRFIVLLKKSGPRQVTPRIVLSECPTRNVTSFFSEAGARKR